MGGWHKGTEAGGADFLDVCVGMVGVVLEGNGWWSMYMCVCVRVCVCVYVFVVCVFVCVRVWVDASMYWRVGERMGMWEAGRVGRRAGGWVSGILKKSRTHP